MKRRNILLKAFEIMLENHRNDFDFCHDIKMISCGNCPYLDDCEENDECPFWEDDDWE